MVGSNIFGVFIAFYRKPLISLVNIGSNP